MSGSLERAFTGGRPTCRREALRQEVGVPGPGTCLRALLHVPLRFGALWQMVYMNFTVSGVRIFLAVTLDEIIRLWPAREERIVLTGHWHILSGIIATILLFYYADLTGLRGRLRQWFGWRVILGSDVAFGAVTVFELKRLSVSESAQQPMVNWPMLLADAGLALVLVVLASPMVRRLADLFSRSGRSTQELADARPYSWGTGIHPSQANIYSSHDLFERIAEGLGDATPVGSFNGRTYDGFETAHSASPYGMYDMPGNVWQ